MRNLTTRTRISGLCAMAALFVAPLADAAYSSVPYTDVFDATNGTVVAGSQGWQVYTGQVESGILPSRHHGWSGTDGGGVTVQGSAAELDGMTLFNEFGQYVLNRPGTSGNYANEPVITIAFECNPALGPDAAVKHTTWSKYGNRFGGPRWNGTYKDSSYYTMMSSVRWFVKTNGLVSAYNGTALANLTHTPMTGPTQVRVDCDYSNRVWSLTLGTELVVSNFALYKPDGYADSGYTKTENNDWCMDYDGLKRVRFIDAGLENGTNSTIDNVVILAGNAPEVTFLSSTAVGPEADLVVTGMVYLSDAPDVDASVGVSIIGGTAVDGVDYTFTPQRAIIPAGETNGTFTFTILNDDVYEVSETILFELSAPTNCLLLTTVISQQTYTIDDISDLAPTVNFWPASASGSEKTSPAGVNVSLSHGYSHTITVDHMLATPAGTATDGVDYNYTSGTLTFDPLVTNQVITFTVVDDPDEEPDETVIFALDNISVGQIGPDSNLVYTILSDIEDVPPTVEFSPAATYVPEGCGTATGTVTLSHGYVGTVTVEHRLATPSGTATVDVDYSYTGDTLVFAAGQTNRLFTFTVIEDSDNEPDETVIFELAAISNGVAGAADTFVCTILDDTNDWVNVPFYEPFEDRVTGDLNGQQGWVSDRVDVQTDVTYGGSTKAGAIDNKVGSMSHTFTDGLTEVWSDMQIQVVYSLEAPVPGANASAAFYVSTNSQVMAFDGGSAVDTGASVIEGDWVRFSTRIDYATSTWTLYVNSLWAGDYGFFNPATAAFGKVQLKSEHGATRVDDIALTADPVPGLGTNYIITAIAGTGGSITPSGAVSVPLGTDQPFTIAADTGRSIADVEVDSLSFGPITDYTFTNVLAAHTIEAFFTNNQYVVIFDVGADGTHTGGGALTQSVAFAAAATAPFVTPNPTYAFDGWDAPFSYVTGDITINALYHTIPTPVVSNQGATPSSPASATVSGLLEAGELAQAWICWGAFDAGTGSTSDWDNVASVGTVVEGIAFNTLLSGLSTNMTYRFRCYATSDSGEGWSPSASIFSGEPVVATGQTFAYGWSYTNWTGDADADVDGAYLYTAAHCFGNNHSNVTVNGVLFQEGWVTNGTGWIIGGNDANNNGDDNAAITGASEDLAEEFVYGANPRTITLTGLTAGKTYRANLYSVAWEDGSRVQTFSAPVGSTNINQDAYGNNNGIRISCVYVATNTSYELTITPAGGTFHMYALANYELALPIANHAPTSISETTASLEGELNAGADGYDVYVWWGDTDGGTNTANWDSSAYVGSWTNVTTDVSYLASGLLNGDTYYYTFLASNATTIAWASPSWQFGTAGPAYTGGVYTITASAGPGGSISPDGLVELREGSNQLYTITADAHFHIDDVVVDLVSQGPTNEYAFLGLTASHTIDATFAIDQYTVIFDVGTDGTHTGGGALTQQVDYAAAAVAPVVTPNPGYGLVGWDASFANVTSNMSVNAVYYSIPAPTLVNQGSTPSNETSATVSGVLAAGETADAWICWGALDGGTTSTGDWDNVVSLGTVTQGVPFDTLIAGLATNVSYLYRCYGTNVNGEGWSVSAESFSGAAAGAVGGSGGDPVNGFYFEWDSAQDSDGDNKWESTTNTYDWTFDGGSLSPVAVADARFTVITNAYVFPAAKDSRNEDMASAVSGADGEPATFELVLDVDGNDGVIFETGGTGDGLAIDVSGGFIRGLIEEDSPDVVVSYELSTEDLGRFIHVIFVADQVNDTAQLYVDGELKDEKEWTLGEDWSGTDDGGLGAKYNSIVEGSSTTDFNGKIALMRFYRNKAFTTEEVSQNFAALSTGGSPIVNLAPTGVTATAATLAAELVAGAEGYDVYAWWGTSDGGTNPAAWTSSAYVGAWSSVTTNVSYPASGLLSGTPYHYTFLASNATTVAWASPSWQFATAGQVFTGTTHNITASAGPGGLVSPAGVIAVPEGSDQGFTIIPDANYHIDDVVVDTVSQGPTNAYTFLNVTEEHAINATFAIDQYTVIFDLGTNGTHSGGGALTQLVDHASAAVEPVVTPDVDFYFDGWDASLANVTSNITINAVYSPKVYSVSFESSSAGAVEGGYTVTGKVVLSAARIMEASVDVSVTGGTATQGSDYTFTPVRVAFPAGETNGTFTFTIVDDTAIEPDETIVFELSNPSNCIFGAYTTYTYTIGEDTSDMYVLPFLEPFEQRTPGDLNGQVGWIAVDTFVQGTNTYGGSALAGEIAGGGGSMRHAFIDARTQVWSDLRLQVTYSEAPPEMPVDAVAAFYVLTNGMVMAFDGTTPVASGKTLSEGQWTRFTTYMDYTTGMWKLFVNGFSAGTYGFYDPTATGFSEVRVNAGDNVAYVDDLFITVDEPVVPVNSSLIIIR